MNDVSDPRMSIEFANLVDHPYSRCSRCDISWKRVHGHGTMWGSSGASPLCDACWAELTPEQRLPHYRVLFDKWVFDGKRRGHDAPAPWPVIERAVLDGK